MKIPVSKTIVFLDRPVHCRASSVRGFFGRQNMESTLMHQHLPNGRSAYLYPRVQYRVMDGMPVLIGINEGVTAVQEAIHELKHMTLNGHPYDVNFVSSDSAEYEIGPSEEAIEYCFKSPWLALSQKNYRKYADSSSMQQKELLERILIGNLLSMAKSLDIVVEERLCAETFLRPKSVFAKGQKMLGFCGRFKLNYCIPDHAALGHLVSIGFGEVARISTSRRTWPSLESRS